MIDKTTDDEIVLVNFRVAKKDREQFDQLFVEGSDRTRADILREMFVNRIANADCEESRERKIERLKKQHTELMTQQNKLIGLLTQSKQYDSLCSVASSFGLDPDFRENIQDVLNKFKAYKIQLSDSFNFYGKELFIELLEAVIDRRKVEAELRAYREKQVS